MKFWGNHEVGKLVLKDQIEKNKEEPKWTLEFPLSDIVGLEGPY